MLPCLLVSSCQLLGLHPKRRCPHLLGLPLLIDAALYRDIQLDDVGLSRIAELAATHQGGLFILDSYNKLTSKLGLKEGSNTYAGPAEDVKEVCAPMFRQ